MSSRSRAEVLVLALCALGLAVPADAGVVGSKHDLSNAGGGMWGATNVDRVCVFCHTSHNASGTTPLWNRTNPVATYTVYQNTGTLQALPNQPSGDSLLCLSCHDGVIALNSLVNPTNPAPIMDPFGDQLGDIYYPGSPSGIGPNIGGNYPANPNVNDLSDDHPVSFTFDAALAAADGGLALPGAASALKLRGIGEDQLECSTCHDPHDDTFGNFLVMSNAQSQLCLTCHLK